jgi:PAS domain S-box-containing protein
MPVLAMVVIVGAFSLSAQQARRVEEEAAAASRERFVAHSLLIAELDAETAVRGYLLTGREAFLDPYAEAVTAASLELERLKRLLADEPKQGDSVRKIDRLGDESLAILIELRSVPSESRQPVLLSRSLDVRRQLRDELDEVVARKNAELSEAQEAAADAERLSTWVIAVSLPLGLLGGLVGMMAFSSGVIRRVRRLEANTERLAAGEPLRSLPPGDDEIGRLGRAFDAAASRVRETEGLLQGVIEGTTDVVFVKDLEGRYLLMNPAGASYLGRPLDHIVGRTDHELYGPDLAARIRESDQVVRDTEEIEVYETTDVIDGMSRTFLTTKGPFRDGSGRLAGIFGIARDITERKLAEARMEEVNAALRESEQMFRQLFAASPDAIVMIDPHDPVVSWPIVDCNEAACHMNGYTRAELIGRSVDILNTTAATPEERAAYLARLRREGVVFIEALHRHKDGHVFPVEISTSIIRLGGRERVLGIDRDVTGRKRLEQELAERAEELERSNKELEQFAYVASHDLQEPLRIVAGYAELLSRRYGGRLDEDADEFIGYTVDGVRRMQRLINDLLHYSRVGTKGQEPAPTDVGRVVDEALRNLGPKIEESVAEVTTDPMPTVPADEGQLIQVFQNLIGNAVKFHGEAPPKVHVCAERRNGEWEFSVADNGIGIEGVYRDQVFEIFQRLHARDEFEGTGIGLAICRKIVDRHGGRIWVESTPGQGSTFRFTIPVETRTGDG